MTHRIGPPLARLRKARLDNLALLPCSELAQIGRYQRIANQLADGGILIVAPARDSKQKQALLRVAKFLAQHGHPVRVVLAG